MTCNKQTFSTVTGETNSLYFHSRQQPLFPSYQTAMTELSVTVTKKNTLVLINPQLPPLCSPNPISNPLCLFFMFVFNKWTVQSAENEQTGREREEGVPEDSENKTLSGSGIDESLKAASKHGLQRDQGKEISEGRAGKKRRRKKKLTSLCEARPTLKVSVAEQRCGKCDHSFNLKLSGVNKEYVAGRDRGRDY